MFLTSQQTVIVPLIKLFKYRENFKSGSGILLFHVQNMGMCGEFSLYNNTYIPRVK